MINTHICSFIAIINIMLWSLSHVQFPSRTMDQGPLRTISREVGVIMDRRKNKHILKYLVLIGLVVLVIILFLLWGVTVGIVY